MRPATFNHLANSPATPPWQPGSASPTTNAPGAPHAIPASLNHLANSPATPPLQPVGAPNHGMYTPGAPHTIPGSLNHLANSPATPPWQPGGAPNHGMYAPGLPHAIPASLNHLANSPATPPWQPGNASPTTNAPGAPHATPIPSIIWPTLQFLPLCRLELLIQACTLPALLMRMEICHSREALKRRVRLPFLQQNNQANRLPQPGSKADCPAFFVRNQARIFLAGWG
ncbi:MAG TPA: hypothetical protein VGD98_14715 [Ktedonobacteraceae bacterium]